MAKAVEAGLRNVVASFGANLSVMQANALKVMAERHGAQQLRIVFDRDEAGCKGAAKAAEVLAQVGLKAEIFEWDTPIGRGRQGEVFIPQTTGDLADLSTEQLQWLRQRRLL